MAKSEKELQELKERIASIKTEICELSADELKQVAGGDGESDCSLYTCPKCGSGDLDYVEMPGYGKYTCNNCGYSWDVLPFSPKN